MCPHSDRAEIRDSCQMTINVRTQKQDLHQMDYAMYNNDHHK